MFVGAGVSMPLGSPSWKALLHEVGEKTGVKVERGESADYPGIAEELRSRLQDFDDQVAALFTTGRHSLSHPLLACLRTRTRVTTNWASRAPRENFMLASADIGIEAAQSLTKALYEHKSH